MATYPLTITSKGGNKRKVSVTDPSGTLLTYGEVDIARAHRKATTLFADNKKKQEMAVLTPTYQNKVLTLDVTEPSGAALGSLVVEGGFTAREFEMRDAHGSSVGHISGENVGREMAGQVIGGLLGASLGRATYNVTMQSGAAVEITLGRGREATVDKTSGDLSSEHEGLLLASLVVWAAYVLS